MYMLTIQDDAVVVQSDYETKVVASFPELQVYLAAEAKKAGVLVDDLEVMSSSSIDFPEEWTSDKATISFAKAIAAYDDINAL